MFKKSQVVLISILLFFFSTQNINAVVDPLIVLNNKFGIHILDETDIEDAAWLVNSSGGDWGYVTFVIRSDERETTRWQKFFDILRKKRIIPIVRIASRQLNEGWEKPSIDEIDGWVNFLNSLNWVTQNRYIVIGNEPNHKKEWGDEINPEEYAFYLKTFSEKLKRVNEDFFVMPAGFDASAPNGNGSISESEYLKRMLQSEPEIFNQIDGWASHSYPNPDFSGSEFGQGRGSVNTFLWELDLLKNLGVEKKLPVFITETGWAHNKNDAINGYFEPDEISQKIKTAFQESWNNENVVAVTPFILNYKEPPFDIFSWKDASGNYYDFFFAVKDIPKVQGQPKQINSGHLLGLILPQIFKKADIFYGVAYIKNTGQVIWEKGTKTFINKNGGRLLIEPVYPDIIYPGHSALVYLFR